MTKKILYGIIFLSAVLITSFFLIEKFLFLWLFSLILLLTFIFQYYSNKKIKNDLRVINSNLKKEIEEYRKSEKKTNEQLEFQKIMMDTVPEPIFFKNKEGIYIGCNKAFEFFVGKSHDEIIGKTVYDLASKEIADIYFLQDMDLLANPGSQQYEGKVKRNDGEIREVIFYKSTFSDQSNEVAGLIGIFFDITDRKKTEEKLQETYKFLQKLLDHLPIAIFALNAENNRFMFWNNLCERIFGFSADEVLGKTPFDIFPKEISGLYGDTNTFSSKLSKKTSSLIYFSKNLGKRNLHITNVPINDEKGNLLFLLTISEDYTEQTASKDALVKSEAKYRSLVEHLNDAIYSLNADGLITYMSPAIFNLTGYYPDEVVGKHFSEFIHPDDNAGLNEIFKETLSGVSKSFEFRIITKDKQVRYLRSSKGFLNEDNPSEGITGVLTDTTEQREAEKELKKHTKIIEKANEELEAFSYSVSHDLRSPLRAIAGFSEILQEEYSVCLDTEAKRMLKIISDNTLKMSQLIDDLLSFFRISKKSVNLIKISMNTLVGEIIKEMQPMVKNVNLKYKIKSLPESYCDKSMIKQVWINLISNAIKFSQSVEKPEIEISGFYERNRNIFYVKDNGVGFDMNYAKKLFGVFQRMHHSDDFEGTGVGLAIVQRIIQKHGGKVWAKGKPGEGAKFFFSLPIREKELVNYIYESPE